ncbi:hypothetical protein CPB83DRAFT_902497 [Crepidotus variabilis]|uniref:Uncharacterized protein n=1 Tax=Crepidotus variabilis TaxID=179855 RepID=A0A9P6JVD4_9AGAR|nr:hypothetical protein CPB83DRAFT_902497 [Crepidotus variabilis]
MFFKLAIFIASILTVFVAAAGPIPAGVKNSCNVPFNAATQSRIITHRPPT